MHLTLLLDFSAGDARWLGGLLWKAALALWMPQLLVLFLVFRRRRKDWESLWRELLLVVAPVLLFVGAVATPKGLGVLLLLVIYSDVQWAQLLAVLALPTVVGLIAVVATRKPNPHPVPAPEPSSPLKTMGLGLAGLAAAVLWWAGPMLVHLYVTARQPPPLQTHDFPFPSRAERARRDSVRRIGEQKRAERYFDSLAQHPHTTPEW
ncbi:hypothetical protein F0P96_07870 [Hymenobacter busanensis]|uniref:Uncharacterized protein n=1 Tax=Hymenobacter busanensis TaxID=2607656 RepID=A0A7L5A308_9BACT|nr:hypothetical protein [Hymenobacter busanensis]KAA9338727.1 hypothetical protein F0P96_07870 [Hymenobacter busanensis]QHJ08842.1 hypothetical protein GUY19_16730 [Hymenobacter busanensis]